MQWIILRICYNFPQFYLSNSIHFRISQGLEKRVGLRFLYQICLHPTRTHWRWTIGDLIKTNCVQFLTILWGNTKNVWTGFFQRFSANRVFHFAETLGFCLESLQSNVFYTLQRVFSWMLWKAANFLPPKLNIFSIFQFELNMRPLHSAWFIRVI